MLENLGKYYFFRENRHFSAKINVTFFEKRPIKCCKIWRNLPFFGQKHLKIGQNRPK